MTGNSELISRPSD